MSSYATLSDLLKFGLNQATLNTATTDTPTQQAHLDAASDLADSYLKSKFKLPLTTWGIGLTQKVCEIAAFTLICVRGFDPDNLADSQIVRRHDEAIKWFVKITEGEVTPPVVDSSGTPGQYGGPNTLQATVLPSSGLATPGGTLTPQTGTDGGIVYVGAPRQRGWNQR